MNKYILQQKYLRKLPDGGYESIPDFFARVAKGVSGDNERLRDDVYQLLSEKKALFGGRTLAAAGIEDAGHHHSLTMLNCFSLSVEDSLSEIMDVGKDTAIILGSGGGIGFDFSKIRPRGARASHRDGVASGPTSFMYIYDAIAQTISQGGARRGACMGLLDIRHPDVEEFVEAKLEEGVLTTFNISVRLTSKFLQAVRDNKDWELRFPIEDGKVYETVKARELLQRICTCAWEKGEPGFQFYDNINAKNPTEHLGPLEISNPCGEALLYDKESCCLGSLNLASFVTEDWTDLRWDELKEATHIMIRALDSVLDETYYPLENSGDSSLREVALRTRKIGLGVLGWHDVLIYLGINYDDEKALQLADKLMSFISGEALKASLVLAEEKGPYPAWQEPAPRARNAVRTCLAPTGSLAVVLERAHSLEPYFAFMYKKRLFAASGEQEEINVVATPLREIAESNDYWGQEKQWKQAIKDFDAQTLEDIMPSELRSLIRGATEISAMAHLKMLEVFQKHTDQGVSKTINMSSSSTVEEIEELVLAAEAMGIKGFTIYRKGSRDLEVLTTAQSVSEEEGVQDLTKVSRPSIRPATVFEVRTKHGNLHATVSTYRDRLYEMFLSLSRAGSDLVPMAEALGRLVTLLFKKGIPPEEIRQQLEGVGGSSTLQRALPDGVAEILKMVQRERGEEGEFKPTVIPKDICPDCHNATLSRGGNCKSCTTCGYSTCG